MEGTFSKNATLKERNHEFYQFGKWGALYDLTSHVQAIRRFKINHASLNYQGFTGKSESLLICTFF